MRAARLHEALQGSWVAPGDREPEPERPARDSRPPRRWVLVGLGREQTSYDRRAIALRALDSAPKGTTLVDGLTGEVVATRTG